MFSVFQAEFLHDINLLYFNNLYVFDTIVIFYLVCW